MLGSVNVSYQTYIPGLCGYSKNLNGIILQEFFFSMSVCYFIILSVEKYKLSIDCRTS